MTGVGFGQSPAVIVGDWLRKETELPQYTDMFLGEGYYDLNAIASIKTGDSLLEKIDAAHRDKVMAAIERLARGEYKPDEQKSALKKDKDAKPKKSVLFGFKDDAKKEDPKKKEDEEKRLKKERKKAELEKMSQADRNKKLAEKEAKKKKKETEQKQKEDKEHEKKQKEKEEKERKEKEKRDKEEKERKEKEDKKGGKKWATVEAAKPMFGQGASPASVASRSTVAGASSSAATATPTVSEPPKVAEAAPAADRPMTRAERNAALAAGPAISPSVSHASGLRPSMAGQSSTVGRSGGASMAGFGGGQFGGGGTVGRNFGSKSSRPSISALAGDVEAANPKQLSRSTSTRNASAVDGMLEWAKKCTTGYPGVNVTNFQLAWKDGLAFCALVNYHYPGLVDWNKAVAMEPMDRLNYAFDAAASLGVPSLLDAVDVCDIPVPEKLSMITYIGCIYKAWSNVYVVPKAVPGPNIK